VLINNAYSKYYAPFEHLVVDKVTVFFKGGVIFKQYVLKMNKPYGIHIYNLGNMRGYRDDMDMFFRKNRTCATAYMTVINVTIKTLYNKGGGTLA